MKKEATTTKFAVRSSYGNVLAPLSAKQFNKLQFHSTQENLKIYYLIDHTLKFSEKTGRMNLRRSSGGTSIYALLNDVLFFVTQDSDPLDTVIHSIGWDLAAARAQHVEFNLGEDTAGLAEIHRAAIRVWKGEGSDEDSELVENAKRCAGY